MRLEIARRSRLPLIRRPPTRLHTARPVASAHIAHTGAGGAEHTVHVPQTVFTEIRKFIDTT
eukprot:5010483-Prymnesium_polylepis.1